MKLALFNKASLFYVIVFTQANFLFLRLTLKSGLFDSDDLNLLLRSEYLNSGLGHANFQDFSGFMYRPLRDEASYFLARIGNLSLQNIHLLQVLVHLGIVFSAAIFIRKLKFPKEMIAAFVIFSLTTPAAMYCAGVYADFGEQVVVVVIVLTLLFSHQQLNSNIQKLTFMLVPILGTVFGLMVKEYALLIPILLFIFRNRGIVQRFVALYPFLISGSIAITYLYLRYSGLTSIKSADDNYRLRLDFFLLVKNFLKFIAYNFIPYSTFLPNLEFGSRNLALELGVFLFVMLLIALHHLQAKQAAYLLIFAVALSLPVVFFQSPAPHQTYLFTLVLSAFLANLFHSNMRNRLISIFLGMSIFLGAFNTSGYISERGKFLVSLNSNLIQEANINNLDELTYTNVGQLYGNSNKSLDLPTINGNLILIAPPEIEDRRYWVMELLDGRRFIGTRYFLENPIKVVYNSNDIPQDATVFLVDRDGRLIKCDQICQGE